jgi:23S rRNA (guanosine2251-2'-O)-methyltransferase
MSSYWLYGTHAVTAALQNPQRVLKEVLSTGKLSPALQERVSERRVPFRLMDNAGLQKLLPMGSVHQGIAVKVEPLEWPSLEALAAAPQGVLVVLDQVTDPHNVGAIIRSATAFGAAAVVVQSKNAPEESAILSKASSGAVEFLPYLTVVNISRTLEELKENGYWCIGLASEATDSLAQLPPYPKTALVLGAEGSGLRPLVAKHCDALVRLPTREAFPSLNVSNAAAVALYALAQKSGS